MHRDIALTNLLLDASLQLLKLADFGLSKYFEAGKSSSGAGGWKGFIAPERLSNDRKVRKAHPFACDIYSWAQCCLYAFTGINPGGNSPPTAEMLPEALAVSKVGNEPFKEFLVKAGGKDASKRPEAKDCLSCIGTLQQHWPGNVCGLTFGHFILQRKTLL